jgi:hypothetical protein
MLPDFLGLLVVAAVFSVPFAFRRLRARRAPAVPMMRRPATVPAVPAAAVHPRATEPFAGDGILTRGEAS